MAKVEQTAGSLTKGEELPTYKVPLVGRFYGNAGSQASEGTAFYASVNKLNEIETKAKAMRKDGKFNEAAEYLRSQPDAPLILRANAAERQIQKLKRDKRDLIEKGADREQVRAKEEQITAVMANMNEIQSVVLPMLLATTVTLSRMVPLGAEPLSVWIEALPPSPGAPTFLSLTRISPAVQLPAVGSVNACATFMPCATTVAVLPGRALLTASATSILLPCLMVTLGPAEPLEIVVFHVSSTVMWSSPVPSMRW